MSIILAKMPAAFMYIPTLYLCILENRTKKFGIAAFETRRERTNNLTTAKTNNNYTNNLKDK